MLTRQPVVSSAYLTLAIEKQVSRLGAALGGGQAEVDQVNRADGEGVQARALVLSAGCLLRLAWSSMAPILLSSALGEGLWRPPLRRTDLPALRALLEQRRLHAGHHRLSKSHLQRLVPAVVLGRPEMQHLAAITQPGLPR